MFRELWGFPHAVPPTNGAQQSPYAASAAGLRGQTSILWKLAQLRPWGRAQVSQTTDCTDRQRKQKMGVQISHRVLFEKMHPRLRSTGLVLSLCPKKSRKTSRCQRSLLRDKTRGERERSPLLPEIMQLRFPNLGNSQGSARTECAMAEPHLEQTTLVITVSPLPGKYTFSGSEPRLCPQGSQ